MNSTNHAYQDMVFGKILTSEFVKVEPWPPPPLESAFFLRFSRSWLEFAHGNAARCWHSPVPPMPPVRNGTSPSLLQSRWQHPPPSDQLVPKDAARGGFACAALGRALPPLGPGQSLVTSARAVCFSRASPQQKVHFTSEPPLSFTAQALEPRSPQIRLLLPVAGDRVALCMLQYNALIPSSEPQRKSHLVCSTKAAHHLPPLQSYQEIRRRKKRHWLKLVTHWALTQQPAETIFLSSKYKSNYYSAIEAFNILDFLR